MSLPCRSFVDGSWIWKKNSSSSRNEIFSGSKTISTASAWSPWLRYVALGVSPPEYPTRVESTPGRWRSSSWAPKKQPPARIAVSVVTCASLCVQHDGEHRDPVRCFLLGAQGDDVPELPREHGWAIVLGSSADGGRADRRHPQRRPLAPRQAHRASAHRVDEESSIPRGRRSG